MTILSPLPTQEYIYNHLLDSLPEQTSNRLISSSELVFLEAGKIICEQFMPSNYVYFPVNCVISLQCMLETGTTSEIAAVGHEGMVGIASFMGGNSVANQAMVQSSGYAYKIKSSIVKEEFQSDPKLQAMLLRYTQALLTQMGQIAVCNRHHTLDKQLARWLLTSLDRLPTAELTVTQEFIAQLLGVRREGVTAAAGKLQRDGCIQYRRGHITITNREKLETMACECYCVVKKEYERLLKVEKSMPSNNVRVLFPEKKQDGIGMSFSK